MKDSGVKWIGEIPDGWEVIRLRFICDIKTGNQDTQDNIPDGIYPFYVRSPIIERSNSYTFEGPSILMAGDGVGAGKVFHLVDGKYGCHQRVYALRNIKKIDLRLLFYYMQNLFANTLIMENAKSTVDSVRLPMIQNFHILVPPKETQQKIATYLDEKCSQIEQTIQNQQQVIEKLKAYKQSLITEAVTGKVKIQNGKVAGKYEQYKDSGVDYLAEIPASWAMKRLRYIGSCQNGISKGGEYFGSGYPFVSYGDVYKNIVLPETVNGLIESTEEERENYSVRTGDIFFTRTSETIEEVGFTSVCLKTIENATFAGFVIRVRPNTDDLIPDFSKYYFKSEAHRRFFVKEMNLVTRASLSQDLLKRLPVLIPPKEEQKSIAEYLDKTCAIIDSAIEQKQKLIEKLTEYKKSLIYECVTGKKEI